jgi:hypothetical protein
MKNILSIDLESWIYIYNEALKDDKKILISTERKTLDNNYTSDATINLLRLLKKYKQSATFFIPGELYDWYPDVIEEIEKSGHEIGYHTHSHPSRIANVNILERELEKSDKFLKRFKPLGFRATQLFITRDSMACLKKWGFKYSSSTYDDFIISKIDDIYEIPVSAISFRRTNKNVQKLPKHLTANLLLRKIPFGSGLFISLFGSKTSYFINFLNKRKKPAIIMVHLWQLYKHDKIKGCSFTLKMFFNNPLCTPYTFSILNGFEKLLERHQFLSFREFFNF